MARISENVCVSDDEKAIIMQYDFNVAADGSDFVVVDPKVKKNRKAGRYAGPDLRALLDDAVTVRTSPGLSQQESIHQMNVSTDEYQLPYSDPDLRAWLDNAFSASGVPVLIQDNDGSKADALMAEVESEQEMDNVVTFPTSAAIPVPESVDKDNPPATITDPDLDMSGTRPKKVKVEKEKRDLNDNRYYRIMTILEENSDIKAEKIGAAVHKKFNWSYDTATINYVVKAYAAAKVVLGEHNRLK